MVVAVWSGGVIDDGDDVVGRGDDNDHDRRRLMITMTSMLMMLPTRVSRVNDDHADDDHGGTNSGGKESIRKAYWYTQLHFGHATNRPPSLRDLIPPPFVASNFDPAAGFPISPPLSEARSLLLSKTIQNQ